MFSFPHDQQRRRRSVQWKRTLALSLLLLFVGLSCDPALGASFGAHAVVGAALGYWLGQNAVYSFVVGLVSHALLDMMPHHDPVLTDRLDVGVFVAFNLGTLFTTAELWRSNDKDSRILWGAIGGMLPDLEHILLFKACEGFDLCEKKIYPSHNGLLPHPGNAPLPGGYALEIGTCYLTIRLAFSF